MGHGVKAAPTEDCVCLLTAREMKVDEQAACGASKRKELQSFCDNSVWQFCDEINQQRTLKARFILMWRTGAAGQQEASVVLHGFRDRDALSGRLKTNSQTLLTIAATEDWPIAVADVRTAYLKVRIRKLRADAAAMLGIAHLPYMKLLKPIVVSRGA